MRSVIYILLSLVFFFVAVDGRSQSKYIFRHISHLDGLSNDAVYSISQDKRGFIWIGTRNGFQRYDGTRFITYRDELNDKNKSLIAVVNIKPSQDHQLFMVSIAGNKKFNLLTNKVSDFDSTDIALDTVGKKRYSGVGGDYWMFGYYYVYHYDASIKKFTCNSFSIAYDEKNHQTWAVSYDYVLMFDDSTGQVYTKKNNVLRHPILEMENSGFRGVMVDSQDNIWFYTWNHKFYKCVAGTKKIVTYSLPEIRAKNHDSNNNDPMYVTCIFEDNRKHLWIATCNVGLLRYHPENDSFTSIRSDNNNVNGLQYNYEVSTIFQDRDDNIWLGTDKGINIFNPYHEYFKTIRHDDNNEKTLSKGGITSFLETRNGDLMVGIYGGGVTVFDKDWNFIKKINFGKSFESNMVWNLIERDDGKIWVGCQHGYLHVYEPSTGSITTTQPAIFENSTIRCMRADSGGNVLFGLHNGKIIEWSDKRNQFISYGGTMSPDFVNNGIQFIYIDSKNRCWISTYSGVKVFDRQSRTLSAAYSPQKNYASGCMGIEELNDTTLIVGLENGGFCFFNMITKQFTVPDFNKKILPASVMAIGKDKKGNIWFTADYNLYRYNIEENKLISYHTERGVVTSSFDMDNFYVLRDGRWLTSTATEAIGFSPDSLDINVNAVMPVEITGLKIFGKRFFVDSLTLESKPLRLSYAQNFLTIEFAALDFSQLKNKKYYYRLHDIDRNWVTADLSGEANYTNLPPGHYDFEVTTDDQANTKNITSFKIIIDPPFWQTWWFRVGAILLIASFIYLLFKRRIIIVRREAALKQQVAETEMMALRAQMNPHFIFNCINSIDALIQSNDKYLATVYLNKFAKLIRNILDSSKQNTVTLTKDLETLQLYIELEQFRNDNKFSCEIDADAALLQDDYKVPPLVIQPYVENAILHGLRYRSDAKGKLSISVTKENGHLIYIVEDNGVGRQAIKNTDKKDKQSYGIEMSNDRVRLFNRENKASVTITDLHEQQMPTGTRVQVILKIQ
ncbi:MAG: histidine kinase [Bacteroidetes bacterium]|nr:histidine kinase [Bacteroidota bacterium]